MAGQKFRVRDGLDCNKGSVDSPNPQDIVYAVWAGSTIGVAVGGTGVATTPTNGQILIGNSSGTYTAANISAGNGISVTNGNGSISITATNSGTVTSVTATSPLLVTVPSTGVYNVAIDGQVSVAKGGTGTATGSITGTGALTFTAGGSNTSVNLVPLGTGSVDVASKKITSVADPTVATDAATKSYVDSVAQGLDIKASVKVATTANITLSGTQTIDGIVLVASDRVLVKDQTTGTQNGIYVVAAGAWTRATDMASGSDASGAFTLFNTVLL